MKLSVFSVAFYSLRKILSFKKSKRGLESFWYSYMTGYRQKLCRDSKAWYETTKGKKNSIHHITTILHHAQGSILSKTRTCYIYACERK